MPYACGYKCVICGGGASALYKMYGPSVLKLNKCEHCKGIVDKYIEFDNVIVIIDLILISKEAQRHVIFNTKFKSFWKIFLVCAVWESYGIWNNDNVLNMAVNSLCGIKTNSTANSTYLDIPINTTLPLPAWWAGHQYCTGWVRAEQGGRFIWEQDFYIYLLSTFAGLAMFILTVHVTQRLLKRISYTRRNPASKVPLLTMYYIDLTDITHGIYIPLLTMYYIDLTDITHGIYMPLLTMLKAFSMAYASTLFTLPMMVWGNADTSLQIRATHYLLGHAYSFFVFYSAFTVLHEESALATLVMLIEAHTAKYLTVFVTTPLLQWLME